MRGKLWVVGVMVVPNLAKLSAEDVNSDIFHV